MKLRDVAKFKLFMMKSNFKKSVMTSYSDVIAIILPKNVIKKRHKIFPPSPIKIYGYTSDK